MYIEGHWETINDLNEAARIVREYYNDELADKIEELIEKVKYPKDSEELESLRYIIEEIRGLVW
jgi:hypothetical protein